MAWGFIRGSREPGKPPVAEERQKPNQAVSLAGRARKEPEAHSGPPGHPDADRLAAHKRASRSPTPARPTRHSPNPGPPHPRTVSDPRNYPRSLAQLIVVTRGVAVGGAPTLAIPGHCGVTDGVAPEPGFGTCPCQQGGRGLASSIDADVELRSGPQTHSAGGWRVSQP